MSDIDDRLEEEILHAFRKSFDSQQAGINANFLMDIQREIERIRADLAAVKEERDRMREALRPFATAAYSNMGGDLNHLHTICSIITLDDLRRARAIFNRAQKKSGAGNE